MEDSMCEVKKRQRGKNFTEREKEYLIDLILPYKSIIENVKVSKFFYLNSLNKFVCYNKVLINILYIKILKI